MREHRSTRDAIAIAIATGADTVTLAAHRRDGRLRPLGRSCVAPALRVAAAALALWSADRSAAALAQTMHRTPHEARENAAAVSARRKRANLRRDKAEVAPAPPAPAPVTGPSRASIEPEATAQVALTETRERAGSDAAQAKIGPDDAAWFDSNESGDAAADARALSGLDDSLSARSDAELGDGARGSSTANLDPDDLARLLARYAHEPTAAQVVAAALQAQRHDPARFAELASRARWRGLLPHLDLGVRRGRGIDLRSTTTGVTESGTTADDLTLFATLRFDLSQLLMANGELSIAREERYARAAQNQLVRQVVRLYFIRRRLLLERDWRGRGELSHELRIAEVEALLDTFTDGTFGRMMKFPHGQPAQTPTLPSSGRR